MIEGKQSNSSSEFLRIVARVGSMSYKEREVVESYDYPRPEWIYITSPLQQFYSVSLYLGYLSGLDSVN